MVQKYLKDRFRTGKNSGNPDSGNGSGGTSYGFPRLECRRFIARFPFANIELKDNDIPFEVELTGWSPFIPTDADNSSLPVGAIEYSLRIQGKSRD